MPGEEYRRRIIETSIELFNTYGCKAVTMDQISSTLHISKRTLYEVFTNKEELLMECLTEVHHRIGQQKVELFNKVNDPLLLTIYVVKTTVFHNEEYFRFLQDADRYYHQLNKTLMQTFNQKFKGIMTTIPEEAEKAGDLRKNVNIANAVNVINMSIALWHNHNRNKDDEEQLSEVVHDSIYTYLRGLCSVKAIMRYDEREEEFKRIIETTNTKNIDKMIEAK